MMQMNGFVDPMLSNTNVSFAPSLALGSRTMSFAKTSSRNVKVKVMSLMFVLKQRSNRNLEGQCAGVVRRTKEGSVRTATLVTITLVAGAQKQMFATMITASL